MAYMIHPIPTIQEESVDILKLQRQTLLQPSLSNRLTKKKFSAGFYLGYKDETQQHEQHHAQMHQKNEMCVQQNEMNKARHENILIRYRTNREKSSFSLNKIARNDKGKYLQNT